MKVYRVMSGDRHMFYVKDVGRIGILNPVYRVLQFINGELVEGDYYYPYICKKLWWNEDKGFYETPINEMRATIYGVLVPIPEHVLNMSKKDVKFYILSNVCDRGVRYTHFEKVSDEELTPGDIINKNLINYAIPKEEAEEYCVNKNTDTYKMYLSERNIPLIFIRKVEDNITTPVLTTELWSKWCSLYLIHVDESVEAINPNRVDDNVRYIDNVWHPDDLVKFCEKKGYKLDELFYEMLLGRWMNEIENIELK